MTGMYDIFLSYSTEDRDRLQPPFGFAMRQVEDFTSWDGRPDHPAFIELAAQIYGLLNDGQQPSQEQNSGCGCLVVVILIAVSLYISNKPKYVAFTHTPVVVTAPYTQKLKHEPTPTDDLLIDHVINSVL